MNELRRSVFYLGIKFTDGFIHIRIFIWAGRFD
jgi:hypothetical protein